MEEINPQALEDFRFKKNDTPGDQSPAVKKKKVDKIKKAVVNKSKTKEN